MFYCDIILMLFNKIFIWSKSAVQLIQYKHLEIAYFESTAEESVESRFAL